MSNISTLGFNGEYLDDTLDSYHLGNGYRAYNPTTMQFTAPDDMSPFGHGGINPYMYCSGDSINNSDPTGHFNIFTFATGALLTGISAASLGGLIFTIVVSGGALSIPALGAMLGSAYGIYAGIDQIDRAVHQPSNITWDQVKSIGINVGIVVAAEFGGAALGAGFKALFPETSASIERTIGRLGLSSLTRRRSSLTNLNSDGSLLLSSLTGRRSSLGVNFNETVLEHVPYEHLEPIKQPGEDDSQAIIRTLLERHANNPNESSGISFSTLVRRRPDGSIQRAIEVDGNYLRLNQAQLDTLRQSGHLIGTSTRRASVEENIMVHHNYSIWYN